MRWTAFDLDLIGFDPDTNEGDIVTIAVATPNGMISIMGEIDIIGPLIVLKGVHIHGENGANTIGIANLKVLAAYLLERIDCNEARVEGATRTTGARRGLKPRVLRFTRRPCD